MVYGPDTMTPMQREFIRLAQIFKSQMVAEVELKQRVIERGLIEDFANNEDRKGEILDRAQNSALALLERKYREYIEKLDEDVLDRKRTRLNSSHSQISY